MIQHDPQLQSSSVPLTETPQNFPGGESVDTDAVNIHDVLDVIFRQRWIILGTVLVVFILGMAYTLAQPKKYEATATILVSPSSARSSADIPIISDLRALTQERSVDTQIEILSSPDLLREACDQLTTAQIQAGFKSSKAPTDAIHIVGKKNTDIILITVQALDPEIASILANDVADTYFEIDARENQKVTHEAFLEVQKSLVDVEQQLHEANARLADYKERTGLIAPDEQLTKMSETLADEEKAIIDTKTALLAGSQSLAALQHEMGRQKSDIIETTQVTNNPRYAAIVASIDDLQTQRTQLVQEYSPTSAEVRAVDARMKEMQSRLKKVADTIVSQQTHALNPLQTELLSSYTKALVEQSAQTARLQALTLDYKALKNVAMRLPKQERDLSEYLQQVQLLTGTYNMLTTRYHELLISEKATLASGRTISKAHPNGSPVSPKIRTNAVLFFFVGLLLAAGITMVMERIDDRVHDQITAENIAQTVTMTAVPEVTVEQSKLITEVDRHSPFLESFRVLRNNIAFTAIDQAVKTTAITSPGPSEGKSTISANLAIIMAMDGKRVLVMDFDLHRPAMHNIFKRPRDVGFTSILTGATSLEQAIVATDIPNVDFLPTGPLPPNPSEVLNSQASRQLFQQLTDKYDAVVVDCPPCTKLSDVQVISTLVDGVLLLLALDRTLKTGLRMTMRALRQVNAPIIGLVLNRMDIRNRRYGYYYSYYYSYVYAEREGEDGTQVRERSRTKKGSSKKQ